MKLKNYLTTIEELNHAETITNEEYKQTLKELMDGDDE